MHNPDILLINPPFHMRVGGGNFLPLGLGYLMSAIENSGYTVEVINCAEECQSFFADDLALFEICPCYMFLFMVYLPYTFTGGTLMSKKFISIVALVLSFVFLFTACNGFGRRYDDDIAALLRRIELLEQDKVDSDDRIAQLEQDKADLQAQIDFIEVVGVGVIPKTESLSVPLYKL